MRDALGVALIALVVGVACGAANGTDARGGLVGTVTKGPIMPVCKRASPATAPPAA
jgi:hypothetical protein